MLETVLLGLGGFILGLGAILALKYLTHRHQIKQANGLADEIKKEAEDEAEALMAEVKLAVTEFTEEAHKKVEGEFEKMAQKLNEANQRCQDQQEEYDEKIQIKEDILNKRRSMIDSSEQKVINRDRRFQERRETRARALTSYIDKLCEQAQVSRDDIKATVRAKIVNDTRELELKNAQVLEEEFVADAERKAKETIHTVMSRFIRPYCPERGLGYLTFDNEAQKQKVMGPDNAHVLEIEKQLGVDLIYNEQANSLSVSGFDPVRRELARLVLEKLGHERQINPGIIQNMIEKCKRDLFSRIRSDGNKVVDELRLRNMNPEIKNMMGALRYRYSFTQNQYFHCAEVGFLCGLLSAELSLNVSDGRRAGLLHDIGKAMDHSIEGGHAVIGADFIQKHGEADEIVHAVRAHHYDETPSTDLAFLVIAADAISGARPGARRSTVDTYVQKMNQLEVIGNSFEGVLNTYVLSAGREVRVVVDSQHVDDVHALRLSRDIAQKIEDECAYPGQIKVTVVRETHAVEFAR